MKIKKGKKTYEKSEKFIIGCKAVSGVPVSDISKSSGMSRVYVYEQKDAVEKYSKSLDEPAIDGKTIVVDKKFINMAILVLALENSSSIEGIQRNLESLYDEHVSIGYISGVLNEAAVKAQVFDDSISLEGIRQGANDEIFQGNTPILTGIDAETSYIYLLEEAADRKAETWEVYMADRQDHGLQLDVSLNDGAAGLISGIKKARPETEIQRDTFHASYEIGKEFSKVERKAYSAIKEENDLKNRVQSGRSQQKTIEKLEDAKQKAEVAINNFDTIAILITWLKELLGFSGYGLHDTTVLIEFILQELGKYRETYPGLVKECEAIRKAMPSLLSFIGRLESKMELCAIELGIPPDAFRLMYQQLAFGIASTRYNDMEYEIVIMLMEKYDEARREFQKVLDGTKKASSLVENLNGRIRVYIDMKRVVPTRFFVLLKVYFNTRRYKRSRIKERVGKSPLELLTGKPQPSFLEALGY